MTDCGRSRAGAAPNRSSGPSASGARRPPTIGSCRRLVGGGEGSRLPSAPGTSPLRTGLRPSSPVCLWPYAPWAGGSLLGIRWWCRAEPHSVPWPPPPSPARRPRRSRGSHGARGPTAGRRAVPRRDGVRPRLLAGSPGPPGSLGGQQGPMWSPCSTRRGPPCPRGGPAGGPAPLGGLSSPLESWSKEPQPGVSAHVGRRWGR